MTSKLNTWPKTYFTKLYKKEKGKIIGWLTHISTWINPYAGYILNHNSSRFNNCKSEMSSPCLMEWKSLKTKFCTGDKMPPNRPFLSYQSHLALNKAKNVCPLLMTSVWTCISKYCLVLSLLLSAWSNSTFINFFYLMIFPLTASIKPTWLPFCCWLYIVSVI